MSKIKWRVKRMGKHAGEVSIIIENCPKCGKEGRLTSHGSRIYGRKLVIKHSGTWRSASGDCAFSWNDEGYDELYEIYKKVRINKEGI